MKHETNKQKSDFKKKTKEGLESWKKRKIFIFYLQILKIIQMIMKKLMNSLMREKTEEEEIKNNLENLEISENSKETIRVLVNLLRIDIIKRIIKDQEK